MAEKNYPINTMQTTFPMKANSVIREVEIQNSWESKRIYERSLEKHKDNLKNGKDVQKFVLHDGPPYLSSARIHIGTALNKVLKDIITKYKSLKGYYAPFVPGYDSHGLPIETAVVKEVKGGRNALSALELRKRCREFALANLKGQEANFKRLGVWGDWEHPYVTLDKHFEAAQIRVFGKMAEAEYLYKGLKSVSWCANCETALAEAEIEYADHVSDAVFVRFQMEAESKSKLPAFAQLDKKVYFVIWTTTPWTLPANLAIALHPQFEYDFLLTKSDEIYVVAKALAESFTAETGTLVERVLGSVLGNELEFIQTKHPFMDRTSVIILGDHVTQEAGTGCVHIAPGHGPEDFDLGAKYKLGVLSPVDARGIFTQEAGPFAGMHINKGGEQIIENLKSSGALIHHSKFSHSYPHCWRCRKPLIFRATEQWFASVSGFRDKALEAIDQVEWLPISGRNRIYNMVENRSDWCISRQRAWGVPIPVFYCKSCNKPLMTSDSIEKVATMFDKDGSDTWWEHEADFFLGKDFPCQSCGHKEFSKETDIMDVWFDSGTTHAGVLDLRPELKGSPCEMYLEGSDQHRGWFQSSLLTSVATKGIPPYKTVLTHGFVVDENGRKMSKSVGNVVDPDDVIKQYGADVLRLWVASVNYTDDVPIGKSMLAQLAEVYRKLRNTARYLLGNLYDFNPEKDRIDFKDLKDLDKFILHRLYEVVGEVTTDFDKYEFFKYYQVLQNFCVVDLSSFYFDIVKDRLYTAGKKSVNRRSVQTVLEEVCRVLVLLLAPVTPHLAEDIWAHIPEHVKKAWQGEESVLLSNFPEMQTVHMDESRADFWKDLIRLRYTVNKALEQARASNKIGSSLEAQVILQIANPELKDKAGSLGKELTSFFITSQATITADQNSINKDVEKLAELDEDGINVLVLKADGIKCARCWKYSEKVGCDPKYPELCDDCVQAILESTDPVCA